MNYIIITKDNIEDFEGLLPTDMVSGGERVSMGAYDDEGFVQGPFPTDSVNMSIP